MDQEPLYVDLAGNFKWNTSTTLLQASDNFTSVGDVWAKSCFRVLIKVYSLKQQDVTQVLAATYSVSHITSEFI